MAASVWCRQASWSAIRPSGMKPWLGGVSSVRLVLVCSLELPLGSLVLFELDRWDRVSLSGKGAPSVVLVGYSWKLEEES